MSEEIVSDVERSEDTTVQELQSECLEEPSKKKCSESKLLQLKNAREKAALSKSKTAEEKNAKILAHEQRTLELERRINKLCDVFEQQNVETQVQRKQRRIHLEDDGEDDGDDIVFVRKKSIPQLKAQLLAEEQRERQERNQKEAQQLRRLFGVNL